MAKLTFKSEGEIKISRLTKCNKVNSQHFCPTTNAKESPSGQNDGHSIVF